jgi:hypothetical protein
MTVAENPYAAPQEISADAPARTNRQTAKKRLLVPGLAASIGGVAMTILSAQEVYLCLVISADVSNRSPSSGRHYLHVAVGMSVLMVSSIFCIYGGIQMLRLRHYALCIAAAIVMTIPVTSPGIWLGWIVGIWALVILLRKDTRAAFAETG